MNVVLLFSLAAAVVAADGDLLYLDKGLIDGLRTGDVGTVYYYLTVGPEKKRIEAGRGEVIDSGDFASTVRVSDGQGRAGYFVDFDLPSERFAPSVFFSFARARFDEDKFEEALRYLKKLETLLPDDPVVDRLTAEIEQKQKEKQWRDEEFQKLDYYRLAVTDSLTRGDEASARHYVDRITRIVPDDALAQRITRELEERKKRFEGMVLGDGGLYDIGVDLPDAKFYNQQPKFQARLEPFWIDRVAMGALVSVSGAPKRQQET